MAPPRRRSVAIARLIRPPSTLGWPRRMRVYVWTTRIATPDPDRFPPQFGRERLQQDADRVAAHHASDLVVLEPGIDERLRELDQPGRVERCLDRAIEVGAEGDVVHAGDVRRVLDRAGDRGGIVAAAGGRPESDADEAAGRRRCLAGARRTGSGRCRRPRERRYARPAPAGSRRPARRRWSRPRRGRHRRSSAAPPSAGSSRGRRRSGRPSPRRGRSHRRRCRRSGSATSSGSRHPRPPRRWPGRRRARARPRSRAGPPSPASSACATPGGARRSAPIG